VFWDSAVGNCDASDYPDAGRLGTFMGDSLQKAAIRGLAWSTIERFGQQFLHFLFAIVLARLLSPSEFGLIAMVTLFVAISQTLVDSGFGAALIQKRDANHLDECSVFYFNIAVGGVGACMMFLAAPWIARFYSQPQLEPITRWMSLLLVINSFGTIQNRILMKRVDFKSLFHVSAIATPISGVLGVVLAFRGYGVWSLVIQQLFFNFLHVCLLWFFVGWRPGWKFSLASLQSMFGYGSKLLATGLLDTVFQNMYDLVIGKVFSASQLGFYTRAKMTQQLLAQNLHATVSRVTFPIFSSIQNDKLRLRDGARKGLVYLGTINFPLMIGLCVVSKSFVSVVFTDKWLPCVPYLQLLCVVGLLYPLSAINLNILSAQGRSDLTLRLEIIKKSVSIVLLVIGWPWGVTGIVMGQVLSSIIAYYINCFYTARLIDYSVVKQVKDLMPVLSIALVMGVIVSMVGWIDYPSELMRLVVQVFIGIGSYGILCRVHRIETYQAIERIVVSKLGRFRRIPIV
jgi:O-antigen/teichoic acid export membrane protein